MTEVWVAVIGMIGGIIMTLLTHYLNNSSKKDNKSFVSIGLKYHPIFSRIDSLVLYVRNGFHVENKGKEFVCKFILEKWFDVWKANALALADTIQKCHDECDTDESDCNKLYNLNMYYINNSYSACTSFFLSSDYTQDEQKVLSLVMEKFNILNNVRIQHMQDNVSNVCNSKFYDDCVIKQAVIFDLYIGFFIDLMDDVEKTFNSINGDLNGLTFKGIII